MVHGELFYERHRSCVCPADDLDRKSFSDPQGPVTAPSVRGLTGGAWSAPRDLNPSQPPERLRCSGYCLACFDVLPGLPRFSNLADFAAVGLIPKCA